MSARGPGRKIVRAFEGVVPNQIGAGLESGTDLGWSPMLGECLIMKGEQRNCARLQNACAFRQPVDRDRDRFREVGQNRMSINKIELAVPEG